MTGEPVRILRYLEWTERLQIFLVLLASGFLMVVLSSITIIVLWQDKNLAANSTPLVVENASTFIHNICKRWSVSNRVLNILSCFLFILACHNTLVVSIWSAKWAGISCSCQFLYTPFGAIINRPSILPLS